jgi:hypothetical protein
MDDIASSRAVYLCGFIIALFAVGLSLALLAGRPDSQRIVVPISTATINPIPDRMPEVPPAVSAAEMIPPAGTQSANTVGYLTDKGSEVAAVEGELEIPFRPMGDATPPTGITGVKSEEPAPSVRRRTRARITGARTATSAAQKLYSPNKYHQVPRGAEKMFDANWQPKAFAYQ